MKDKISKFINVTKRDGILKTLKKTWTYIIGNYFNKINIRKRILYSLKRKDISKEIDEILNSNKYDRIMVWKGSFGWNVPLFQRPQQIAKTLSEQRCLVLYEVTRMTDKIDFFKKEKENLYLIDYEISKFEKLLFEKLKNTKKPKYLELASTCWNVKKEEVDKYLANGFKMLYEYIDDLNPVLAGTDKLPKNVESIHNLIINNKDIFVVASADKLYEDIISKRKSKKNVILSTNGGDYIHFSKNTTGKIKKLEELKDNYELIIGYYGALASWFDYDLVKKLAENFPKIAFVLIGIKYDTTFDSARLEEYQNIFYLGGVEYKKLPTYAKYFDIAWIPFVINEITNATNPVKLFEYMALNKLIITSAMPECMKYKSVYIAKDYDDYTKYIKGYKKLYNSKYKNILKKEAQENSWEYKATEIINLLKTSE